MKFFPLLIGFLFILPMAYALSPMPPPEEGFLDTFSPEVIFGLLLLLVSVGTLIFLITKVTEGKVEPITLLGFLLIGIVVIYALPVMFGLAGFDISTIGVMAWLIMLALTFMGLAQLLLFKDFKKERVILFATVTGILIAALIVLPIFLPDIFPIGQVVQAQSFARTVMAVFQ